MFQKSAMVAPLAYEPRTLLRGTEYPVFIACVLIVVWALMDIFRSYPDHFFPRYWDEAVYALDALKPGAMLGDYSSEILRYGPAKLGYGLPLSWTVSLLGANGIMYFSTACWTLGIALIVVTMIRQFGLPAAAIGGAFLVYSPLYGKYIAEAAPTTLAGLAFVVLWILHQRHRFWLTGLALGVLALIDFKWALPAGLAFVIVELAIERNRLLKHRLIFIALAGLTACASIGLIAVLHRPFFDYLRHYVSGHAELMGFAPSAIFLYYLGLFGAGVVTTVAGIGAVFAYRRQSFSLSSAQARAAGSAAVFFLVPVVFFSLFGQLKALRFFAVTFPLAAVPLGVSLAAALRGIAPPESPGGGRRRSLSVVTALIIGGAIVVASDGPAKHFRYPAGIETALARLETTTPRDSSVASFIWPVVQYRWRFPTPRSPYLGWGLLETDKWMLLDPMIDRVTMEMRRRLVGGERISYDTAWTMVQARLRQAATPLFSVPNDFYATDYYLAENVVGGIPVLRRWQSWRTERGNYLEVCALEPEKSRSLRQHRALYTQ